MKMEKEELISVIMPTYNRGYVISNAIDSILNQSYANFELIIVDDCSSDNTEEIVRSYQKKDKRIIYIKLDRNSGANYARNIGLKKATGDYITFQDSDDISLSNRLETEMNVLKSEDVDWVFSSFRKINGKKKIIIPKKQIKEEEIAETLLFKNLITTQVLFSKRKIFDEVKFDDNLPRFQDWDLAIRISKKYRGKHINKVLLDMYIQNDSITKNPQKGKIALKLIKEKYINDLNRKQLARLYCRIGLFEMLCDEDATINFKKSIIYEKNIKYIIIFILYKLKILKTVYCLLKK